MDVERRPDLGQVIGDLRRPIIPCARSHSRTRVDAQDCPRAPGAEPQANGRKRAADELGGVKFRHERSYLNVAYPWFLTSGSSEIGSIYPVPPSSGTSILILKLA